MNSGIQRPNDKFEHVNDRYEPYHTKVDKHDFPLYFDVDGTLLGWHDEINWKLLAQAKACKKAGYKLILWSYGGASWAQRFVNLTNTDDLWDLVLGKPGVLIDDNAKQSIFNLGTHLYPDDAEEHLLDYLEEGGY